MKFSLIVLLVLLFWGCANSISEEALSNLNGYWEIEKVTFPSGRTKEFKTSTTVDYFEIENMNGFRKKLQPKFNGTFETSNDAELFTLSKTEDTFVFSYKNADNEWKERILEVSQTGFSVVNSDSIIYTYKRFQPVKMTP